MVRIDNHSALRTGIPTTKKQDTIYPKSSPLKRNEDNQIYERYSQLS